MHVNIDHPFFRIIKESNSSDDAKNKLLTKLEEIERNLQGNLTQHRSQALQSITVLKNVMAPVNEKRAGFNTIDNLKKTLKDPQGKNEAFLLEFHHLFKSIDENPDIPLLPLQNDRLDVFGRNLTDQIKRFSSQNKTYQKKIMEYFDATEKDWQSWHWHLSRVIKKAIILNDILTLTKDEKVALKQAEKNHIPFAVTPFYLSLVNPELSAPIRSQFIPSLEYSKVLSNDLPCDFMEERLTTPIELVSRRYPCIAILKPIKTCPQICIYCQRNWEIEDALAPSALATDDQLKRAIEWYRKHPEIQEVLITGGDPGLLSDNRLDKLLHDISKIKHISRIRIATRMPVNLPFRVTSEWVGILSKYHHLPEKEIYLVTHVQHQEEITPELLEAVKKIKRAGMNVYNQHVLVRQVSKRFQAVALRNSLKSAGIDPYYTFFPKGKNETREYLIPIARILQEQKEEARLLPGSVRTDESVFNVPKLGKNHLRASQDRELIAIDLDGSRIYAMHPWEKNLSEQKAYIYHDIPIKEYLDSLEKIGEKAKDYSSIWYYY